jgi:hypothetical protein
MLVRRKSYIRKDGTRVKATTVRVKSSGRGRGNKTKSAKFSRSKGYKPWIKRKGKLGGKGFLSKSPSEEHKLLDKCVKKYGYRSCLGSVMVLSRSRAIQRSHGRKLNSLKNYLKKKHSLK